MITKYRPLFAVIAATADVRLARELNLVWGVISLFALAVSGDSIEAKSAAVIEMLSDLNLLSSTDYVILVCSSPLAESGLFLGLFNVKKILQK